MILLDTNVVSASMAPAPPRVVLDWLNRQDAETLFLSAVTIAEIHYGLRMLPDGRRRQALTGRFAEFVSAGFALRLLAFDALAANEYGDIMAHRR